MRRWLVELDGERSDVEEFPKRFPDGDIHAVEDDGKVYLTGSAFDQFSEGQLVRNHAMGAVEEMSAIISLLWPAFQKPLVGSVYREDGKGGRSTWLFPVTGTLRIKSGDVRTSGDTEATAAGPTQAQKLLAASRTTDYLHAAVLLWAAAEPAWWRLYRIVEELTEHFGMTAAKAGLCSANELERFEHTSNSADASGLGARHRTGKFPPPATPMTLDEAAIFVKGLLEQALKHAASAISQADR